MALRFSGGILAQSVLLGSGTRRLHQHPRIPLAEVSKSATYRRPGCRHGRFILRWSAVGQEETQEPTAELDLTGRAGDDAPPTDPDDEWNPSESLDLTYANLLEALKMIRSSVSDTASTRKVVEFQIQQLEERVKALIGSPGSVRTIINEQIADLRTQLNQIGARFENLLSISDQFQRDVERFRTEKELLKASYAAVEAVTLMGDAISPAPRLAQRWGQTEGHP